MLDFGASMVAPRRLEMATTLKAPTCRMASGVKAAVGLGLVAGAATYFASHNGTALSKRRAELPLWSFRHILASSLRSATSRVRARSNYVNGNTHSFQGKTTITSGPGSL